MKQVVELHPGVSVTTFMGWKIENVSNEPIYVRLGLRSIKVSNRKPAPYGIKKSKEQTQ